MKFSLGLMLLVVTFSLVFLPAASAVVLWDEATQGDFSGDFAAPTDLGTLGPGSNTVTAQSTAGPTEDLTIPAAPGYPGIDVDLWKLTIAPGEYLNQIVLTSYANSNPYGHTGGSGGTPGGGSFFAFQAGSEITVTIPDGSDLLGGALIGVIPGSQAADDVLDDLGGGMFSVAPFNVPTFNGPLGAGTYTFWYQEGPMDTEYTLDYQVSTVPEPASMTGLGLLALATIMVLRARAPKGS